MSSIMSEVLFYSISSVLQEAGNLLEAKDCISEEKPGTIEPDPISQYLQKLLPILFYFPLQWKKPPRERLL